MSPAPEKGFFVLAALLAAVVFVFPLAAAFPLLDPDEGLHASIAQEMVESGDWLLSHFLGKPFLDKPFFFFWCQAASLKLFGMNEVGIRLPGLLLGLLGTITTGIFGGRMFGRTVGWIAFLFYGTMILPVALAQAAAHDVALVPEINLALLLLWQWDQKPTRKNFAVYLAALGLLLGLSILTKGLVGLALVGVTFGSYLLFARRLTWAACGRLVVAFLGAVLVAFPWYLSVENAHPGYLKYYFVERHLLGFATSTQTHGQAPWWYYLPVLFGGGLPWIGYLPATIRQAVGRGSEGIGFSSIFLPHSALLTPHSSSLIPHPSSLTLLWCWLVGWTALMSLARSKLATYLWPVFPAVAILAAVPWSKLIEGALAGKARRSLLSTFFVSSVTGPLVLPLAAAVVQKMYGVEFTWIVWTAVVLAGAAPLAPLVFFFRKNWRAMLTASIASTAVQFIAAIGFVLPPIAAQLTASELASYFNAQGALPARVLIAEERIGSLVFYLDPRLRAGLAEDQIQQVYPEKKVVLTASDAVVVPERRAERAEEYLDLEGWETKTVGHYRLYRHPGRKE